MEYTINMALPQLKEEEYFTYADFLEWDESVRAELHDGEVYMMAPPLRVHQEVFIQLVLQIGNYLKGKKCKLYPAPFGVRLFPKKDKSDDTVFEPDIVVICDQEKLDDRGCNGAPDLVIEILSPSTAKYDRVYKFRKYQKAGVREYWIVDPETKTVQVCLLENDRYVVDVYEDPEKVPVFVLEGCEVDLKEVFAE